MASEDIEATAQEAKSSTEILRQLRKQKKERQQREQRQDPSTLRDVLGFVLILTAIAWLLMLISYSPSDPSNLYSATSQHRTENLLGKVGANVAAYSYQVSGFGSFLFPFCMIYLGVLCIRSRRVNDWYFQLLGGSIVIFVLLTWMGSFPPVHIGEQPHAPGGFMGVTLWAKFTAYLNPVGTYLFLMGTIGVTFLVITQLTLRDLGRLSIRALHWCMVKLSEFRRILQRKREALVKKRVQSKIIQRELDKIEKGKKKRPKRPKSATDEPFPAQDFDAAVDAVEVAPGEPKVFESVKVPSHRDPQPPVEKPDVDLDPDTGQIKVNKMKEDKPVQEAFQFVENLNQEWVYPTSFFFLKPSQEHKIDEQELLAKARSLEAKLNEFSVTGEMKEIHPGPVVTTYEFKPDAGIKYSKIVNLTDDLCLALGAESIRIDRMPGRSSIGMEVPNDKRELITFREMIESERFVKDKAKLLLCLGKTIDGSTSYSDLAKMPHLLIAGQTGSGKSVGINAMICSILMRNRPDEVKLIMIDPKMVEMGIYADIPHLLTPVVTDPNEAANALKWAVLEMERRYKLLAAYKIRNLDQYNQKVRSGMEQVEGADPPELLPYIVVIIDEMADLMMVARGEVEESIARLAQKSRAIGIHLVLATQRPSVDIITGVIKSNLPSRLSYRVSQRNDSRIILDSNGAERLLGRGDGLFLGPGTSRLIRIHAPFLSEPEVIDLVKFLKNQGQPDYQNHILKPVAESDDDGSSAGSARGKTKKEDPMYDKAARLVLRSGQASVSYIQRKLSLGYNRAARLIDMMEDEGLVGPNVGSKARDILVPSDYFDEVDSTKF